MLDTQSTNPLLQIKEQLPCQLEEDGSHGYFTITIQASRHSTSCTSPTDSGACTTSNPRQEASTLEKTRTESAEQKRSKQLHLYSSKMLVIWVY